jgi:hypothetical protein
MIPSTPQRDDSNSVNEVTPVSQYRRDPEFKLNTPEALHHLGETRHSSFMYVGQVSQLFDMIDNFNLTSVCHARL